MTDLKSTVIKDTSPELFEFLHNLVQDAQATGAIDNIITIIPASMQDIGDDSEIETIKCKPKNETCPK